MVWIAGWMILSLPYLILTTLDSEFLPDKLRAYVEAVTLSRLWIILFLMAVFMFSLMLIDACSECESTPPPALTALALAHVVFAMCCTARRSQMSPLPSFTKWVMFITLVLVYVACRPISLAGTVALTHL